jgi:polyphosphate kinase
VEITGRFYVLPESKEKTFVILLDDIVRSCCDILFSIFDFDEFHSYTVKLTRDSELDLETDLEEDLLEQIARSLKKRKKGQPTRFVYDERIPDEMLQFLIRKLKLSSRGLIPGGRYHNFKDFKDFPDSSHPQLKYGAQSPGLIKRLEQEKRMFDVITRGDIILHHPYQSFDYIIRFMREAALDPAVRSIQITLYRVARKSNIVRALINAVKNGVKVTVFMELQARFDEEDNIYWAKKLDEAGATVYYGKPGQKIHCKMCLVTRKEGQETVLYGHLSTGNYNRITAKLYCDHGLLTKDPRLTKDMANIFKHLNTPEKLKVPKHLLLAPVNMKQRFMDMISREIQHKKSGKDSYIIGKMNSLVDSEIITKLYEASNAGVRIQLIIRGICCLVPGRKGQSENIMVTSIIDRYLEHARIYIFANGGDEELYLSSADWMTRNLEHRVETAFPILDENCKNEIKKILEIQLRDNCKAREINEEQNNPYKLSRKAPVRAQPETQTYISHL